MHQQVERWVREYGPLLQLPHRPPAHPRGRRPRGDGRAAARPPGRLSPHQAGSPRSRREIGSAGRRLRRRRRGVEAAAQDGDGGLRPAPSARVLSVAGEGERAARRALAARRRAGTPIDLQADLMRYTVDTVAGLAFGAEVNTLESDADVIQRHLDKIFPASFAACWRRADLALVEVGRRPRARRAASPRSSVAIHDFIAAGARAARGPGAPRRAEEPARGDDRRRRRSRSGNRRRARSTATC